MNLLLVVALFCWQVRWSRAMDDENARPRFRLFWNVPSAACTGPDTLHPEEYGITANRDQAFFGEQIAIFYEFNLGLYPKLVVQEDGSFEWRNHGIPQKVDLQAHLDKLKLDVNRLVPNASFSGLLVVDWEDWRPLMDMNWSSRRRYLTASIEWARTRFPHVSEATLRSIAVREFDQSAKIFIVQSLRAIKTLRPFAQVGMYDYTMCNYDAGKDSSTEIECNARHQRGNERMLWMYQEFTAMFPAIYYYKDRKSMDRDYRHRYTHARISEALRIRALMQREIPIYPYTKLEYVLSDFDAPNHYYSKRDICISTRYAANFAIDGLVIWTTSKNMKQHCPSMKRYLEQKYGYRAKKIVTDIDTCSREKCHGNGRCVAPDLTPTPGTECRFKSLTKHAAQCRCDPGYSGPTCQEHSDSNATRRRLPVQLPVPAEDEGVFGDELEERDLLSQ